MEVGGGRGRWLAAMQAARTPEAVSLGVLSLKAHCGRFAPIQVTDGDKKDAFGRKRKAREEAVSITEGFYHAAAWGPAEDDEEGEGGVIDERRGGEEEESVLPCVFGFVVV